MAQSMSNTLVRVATAGSVDDGKSTLIGRLLYDSESICDDHLRALRIKGPNGEESLSLALLTDGLKSEREQQITIDVAYRYFSSKNRHFILADAPGHEQYTRNMVTAASTADVLIVLVDATKGVLDQTRRHSFIGALMGVPRLLVVINKMDLVRYSQEVFEKIKNEYLELASKLSVKDIRFIPVSALNGDNVVTLSQTMPWYYSETVFEYLENIYVGADRNVIDLRFPVQRVIRPDQNFRGYGGQIASGTIRAGDEVTVFPSRVTAKVKRITTVSPSMDLIPRADAEAPLSIVVELDRDVDIARGDMIARSANTPRMAYSLEALLVWMGDVPLDQTKSYILRHTTREVRVSIETMRYAIDVNSLHRKETGVIEKNEICCVRILCRQPVFVDDYRINRATGAFVLIDPDDYFTVCAGMIIERARAIPGPSEDIHNDGMHNLHEEHSLVTHLERERRAGHGIFTIWLTGLSGAGKSTIAKLIEAKLFENGYAIYRLDGDILRSRLNRDLGFSSRDRAENIRRAAEVAAVLNDAGVSTICSFISPLAEDRERARKIIGTDRFFEVFIQAPLEVCEGRDPHQLYKRARSGELKDFTGVSSPYEEPVSPWLTIDAVHMAPEESAMKVIEKLMLTLIKPRAAL